MIKRLAILLLLSSPLFAGDIIQAQFGYLNTNQSPAVIDPTQAQDLLNVDVTPDGKSVKKRSGYGLYKTLSTSQPLHGGYHFFDSVGNDVQIWASSTSLWGIVGDATPTQLVSSGTLNSTWQCTDAQGFAYCVDSSRDALIKTNGATITWYMTPLGTMAAITPERLMIAGVASTPNTIYYSAASNFTNFSVGINAPDSSSEQIASPGSRLTHLQYACNRWLWWKDQSFGYVLGTDQTNLVIKTVSNVIGTQDNSDAIDPNGNVYFRGQDGHIYVYDCNSLTKLTIDITPNIQTSGRRVANLWLMSTTSDFNSGSKSSTTVTAGDGVQISTNDVNFTDNSFENESWLAAVGSVISYATGGVSPDGCATINAKDGSIFVTDSHLAGVSSETLTVSMIDAATSAIYSSTTVNYSDGACTWTQRTLPVNITAKTFVKIKVAVNSNSMTSPAFTASAGNITFWTVSAKAFTVPFFGIDFFQKGMTNLTQGIYYSPVHNNQNLTSWDTFNTVSQDNGGSHTFSIRSSSNPFSILSSTPSWVAQSVGSIVAASTGTYVQWKDTFTVTLSSQNPVLQSVTVNWFEGTASDKAYATYFDNSILWSLSYGQGQTTNNYIFKFDLLNPGWTLYNFGAGGFLLQNNNLYFGSTASDGKIFRYGNATSDAGSSINAYWKSKDFSGDDVFLENNYRQLDVIARQNTGQSLTVGYTLNGSTSTASSYSINLSSSTNSTIRYKKLLPNSAVGALFNVQVGDNTTTSAWEVLGFRVRYDPLSYQPTR